MSWHNPEIPVLRPRGDFHLYESRHLCASSDEICHFRIMLDIILFWQFESTALSITIFTSALSTDEPFKGRMSFMLTVDLASVQSPIYSFLGSYALILSR